MSTIALIHEGPMSLEHLENMCITSQAVYDVVKGKGAKRHESKKRDHRGSEKSHSAFHSAKQCHDRYCCPKGFKPSRPTNHELSLVALYADYDGQFPFRVTVPQSVCRHTDDLVRQVTKHNASDPVLSAMKPIKVSIKSRSESWMKDEAWRRKHDTSTKVLDRGPIQVSDTILVQRPLGEAKAAPKITAIQAERAAKGQYNNTGYALSRGSK